jgi:Family of unknown function (DUF5681)
MAFQPGKSGNPGGRPKELKGIQDLARTHCPEAIKTLVAVCKGGKSESARVTAAVALMDRGYGRPPQFNTADVSQFRRAIEMSDDELASIATGSSEGTSAPPVDPSQLN